MVLTVYSRRISLARFSQLITMADEFKPDESSDDDEATIAREDDDPDEQESELAALQKDSEQTLDDLLSQLPSEYFENAGESDGSQTASVSPEPSNDSVMDESTKDSVDTPEDSDESDEDEVEEAEGGLEDLVETQKELEDASAVAQTLQPKGFTLSSTQVRASHYPCLKTEGKFHCNALSEGNFHLNGPLAHLNVVLYGKYHSEFSTMLLVNDGIFRT